MEAALNEYMLVGVNIILRDNPRPGSENGDNNFHCEFQVIGQVPVEEFKKLRKTAHEKELMLRCDFGEFRVQLRHLEYDSIKETFSLYVAEKA
jgi:hypothetical protein